MLLFHPNPTLIKPASIFSKIGVNLQLNLRNDTFWKSIIPLGHGPGSQGSVHRVPEECNGMVMGDASYVKKRGLYHSIEACGKSIRTALQQSLDHPSVLGLGLRSLPLPVSLLLSLPLWLWRSPICGDRFTFRSPRMC